MNKKKRLIIILMSSLGVYLTTCDNGNEKIKIIKLTGLEQKYTMVIRAALDITYEYFDNRDLYASPSSIIINDGIAIIEICDYEKIKYDEYGNTMLPFWKGSGSYYFFISLWGETNNEYILYDYISKNKITIKNNITYIDYKNNFTLINNKIYKK